MGPLPEIWGQNPQFLAIFVENRYFWRPLADNRPHDLRQTVARDKPDNICYGHFCARGYRLGAMRPQNILIQRFWRNLAILTPSIELIYELIATRPLRYDSARWGLKARMGIFAVGCTVWGLEAPKFNFCRFWPKIDSLAPSGELIYISIATGLLPNDGPSRGAQSLYQILFC